MYADIAKALISNADGIIGAIDRYITKEDDDLKKLLEDEGFADPEETVKQINLTEEQIAVILQEQTDGLLKILHEAEENEISVDELQKRIADFLLLDIIAQSVQQAAIEMYESQVPTLASIYMKESDGESVVAALRERTTRWMQKWSHELGKLTKISTHQQIASIIEDTVSEGYSIADLTAKIQNGGWRNEYYQARRFGLTETLRAHSVAREEAIQQSPATEQKEWRHTGAHKNNPRPNHVAMDYQLVPKEQSFELRGRDGTLYHPMFPRDPLLPAAEAVNCHCIHRGIVSEKVLGLSYEQRKAMQDEIIRNDDAAFQAEADAKAKAQAGINEDTVFLDALKAKTKEKQVKYCGGKKKWALVESGIVKDDAMLHKIRTTSLKDLDAGGILTIKDATLNHSVTGTYKAATKQYPNGRMVSGGHTQAAMDACTSKGIEYSISGTFSNGVRIGNVPSSQLKVKKTGNGQAWFPENWDSEKVLIAGTAVANDGTELIDGYHKTGIYDGFAVRVLYDKGGVVTICPDLDQDLYVEGVEALNDGGIA